MILVVDASVLFSALIKRSYSLDLIEVLFSKGDGLYSPQYLLEEVGKRRDRLLKFSKLAPLELDFVIQFLLEKIKIVPESEYETFISEAKILAPHIKDAPYFALALHLSCPILSDEKAFKRQSKVKVYNTSELLKEAGLK